MATATAPYSAAPVVKERPLGVVILAVLYVLEGLVMLLGAVGMMFAGALLGSVGDETGVGSLLGAISAIVGVVLLIFAILAFLVAWGLYSGKGWARFIAIILAVLSLIIGLVSLVSLSWTSAVQLVIAIIILYYLFQPRVKAFYV